MSNKFDVPFYLIDFIKSDMTDTFYERLINTNMDKKISLNCLTLLNMYYIIKNNEFDYNFKLFIKEDINKYFFEKFEYVKNLKSTITNLTEENSKLKIELANKIDRKIHESFINKYNNSEYERSNLISNYNVLNKKYNELKNKHNDLKNKHNDLKKTKDKDREKNIDRGRTIKKSKKPKRLNSKEISRRKNRY